MLDDALDIKFKEAIRIANEKIPKDSVPQDLQLVLYAYYKQGLSETINYGSHGYENDELINAFKLNAWMQVSSLSADEAKKRYIQIINDLLQEQEDNSSKK